ncbi:hypothetical protein [Streptomyces sp. NPDC005303]|uniref:hypothetical protein n=1 Tax=Streptomyces sp. NPDC005303 TaxID=3155713 RepID=UPI0033BF67B7
MALPPVRGQQHGKRGTVGAVTLDRPWRPHPCLTAPSPTTAGAVALTLVDHRALGLDATVGKRLPNTLTYGYR